MTNGDATLRKRVEDNPLWYHTLDLGGGVTTKGWFDLRPVIDRLPWPDVAGKRCLDVGTYDGELAFELERRGAEVVVATDIPSHNDWDWLPRERAGGIEYLNSIGSRKGLGFEIAAEALGSKVKREFISIYDLSPDRIGVFDVVTCGSLLLHLRDPWRALDAIHSVCSGVFMSAEQIDPLLTLMHPRRPCFRLIGENGQWTVPNVTGHRYLLHMAGFDLVKSAKPYAIPLGPAHPVPTNTLQSLRTRLVRRVATGGSGVPMSAVLVRPAD